MRTHHKIGIAAAGIAALGLWAWNSDKPTPLAPPAPVAVETSGLCHAVTRISGGVSYVLPDPVCTPGKFNADVTTETAGDNICNSGWSTKSIRPPVSYTSGLKICQLTGQGCEKYPGARQYDYADQNPADYELDHLISLTDGGDPTSPLNLWPQPYSPAPGAKEKDKAELVVHKNICSLPEQLDQQRSALAKDWFQFFTPGSSSSFGGIQSPDPDDN